MDDNTKSSISFVQSIYKPKVAGFLLAFLAISTSFYGTVSSKIVWGLLFFWIFIWPHLAYQWARHSKKPTKTEVRNLYIDAFIIGLWVPLMSFNFIPSLSILSMHLLSMITILGFRKSMLGLLTEFLGIAVATAFVDFNVNLDSQMYQILACIPVLVIYPLFVGFSTYKLSLAVSEKQRELVNLSRTDGLTGLNNRRYWENRLDKCFKLNQREFSETCIIFIDVDHFKKVNDQYGHIVGDEVLQKIASILLESARDTDICCRYGGEEFCILAPRTDQQDAKILAERIRRQIANTQLHSEQPITGSISIGIAEISKEMHSYSDWLTVADNALYQAKLNGRNQVVVAINE